MYRRRGCTGVIYRRRGCTGVLYRKRCCTRVIYRRRGFTAVMYRRRGCTGHVYRRRGCTGLVYRSNVQEEGLYSGLETSEYSDYASPVTEELPLSPLSQRSCDTCEELQEDSGRSWLTSHTIIPTPHLDDSQNWLPRCCAFIGLAMKLGSCFVVISLWRWELGWQGAGHWGVSKYSCWD